MIIPCPLKEHVRQNPNRNGHISKKQQPNTSCPPTFMSIVAPYLNASKIKTRDLYDFKEFRLQNPASFEREHIYSQEMDETNYKDDFSLKQNMPIDKISFRSQNNQFSPQLENRFQNSGTNEDSLSMNRYLFENRNNEASSLQIFVSLVEDLAQKQNSEWDERSFAVISNFKNDIIQMVRKEGDSG